MGDEGEMSIEETNKLRLSLGLKPLEEEGAKAGTSSNPQIVAPVLTSSRDRDPWEEEFRKKGKRKHGKKEGGNFLDDFDAKQWVKDNRMEGDTVILTLKDKRIITKDGELDDTVDELEDIYLAEERRRLGKGANDDIEGIGQIADDELDHEREMTEEEKKRRGPAISLETTARPQGFVQPPPLKIRKRVKPGAEREVKIEEEEKPNAPDMTFVAVGGDDEEEQEMDEMYGQLMRNSKTTRKAAVVEEVDVDESAESFELNQDVLKRLKEEAKPLDSEFDRSQIERHNEILAAVEKSEGLDKKLTSFVNAVKKEETGEEGRYAAVDKWGANSNLEKEGADKGAVELTPITEFCRTVLTPLEKLEAIKNETYAGSALYKQQELANQKKYERKSTRNEKQADADMESDGRESDNDAEDEDIESVLNEAKMDGGIACALSFLKSRGDLSDDSWRIGRENKANAPMHTSTEADDVLLEYKDDYHRVMTPKEAFRYISWIFHGKKPGKKKLEKALRQMETEKSLKSKDPQSYSKTMRALAAVQSKEGTAHMIL